MCIYTKIIAIHDMMAQNSLSRGLVIEGKIKNHH